jgi:hypothetical protein
MVFSCESMTSIWAEASDMMVRNNDETGMFDLDPESSDYFAMEEAGQAKVLTARVGGSLVGYSLMILRNHPHHRKVMVSFQDVLYMHPAHRGFGAVRFIRWTDEFMKALGAEVMTRSVSVKKDYSRTLERLGYEKVETSYMRRL